MSEQFNNNSYKSLNNNENKHQLNNNLSKLTIQQQVPPITRTNEYYYANHNQYEPHGQASYLNAHDLNVYNRHQTSNNSHYSQSNTSNQVFI